VMERLPHTFLVAEGAARFAKEMGFDQETLLTEEMSALWRAGIEGRVPTEVSIFEEPLAALTSLAADPSHVAGTVNVLALDSLGHIACAVSTSGWAWKHPGRVGDSPVVGAGIYADDRYAAAACTGMGELSMRACLARDIVTRIAFGASIEEAGRAGITDMASMAREFPNSATMNVVVLTRTGATGGFTTRAGVNYVEMRDAERGPELVPTAYIEWPGVTPPAPSPTTLR
jgi:beta-aspartyl-peptidase (threonine type)